MRRWTLCLLLCMAIFWTGCGSKDRVVVTVAVNPNTASLAVMGTFQFIAQVAGTTNTGVTWFVNDVMGGNATVGTISVNGFYTAPNMVPSPATVTIKATSVADTNVSGTAMVTINSGINVTVAPATATLGTGENIQFTATVTGTSNLAVNWSVNNVAGGNSTVGTISTTGLYTAPASVPNPSTVTISAASAADATRMGSASVGILAAAAPTLTSISPTTAAQGSIFLDLYLEGSNFVTTSVVRVNGTQVPATLIASTLLRARVPDTLLSIPGMFAVDVMAQGGMTSASQNLTVTAVRPALVGTSPDSASQGGAAVSVDFNGGYYSNSVTAEFSGQVRIASLTSARQLNVAIGAADLSNAGLFSVVVRNSAAVPPIAAVNLAVQPSATPSVTATLTVGMQPSAVAINTTTGIAVVANRGSGTISLIDLGTNTVLGTPIPVGTSPTGVAVDNERNLAVVANNGNDTISVVDLATSAVVTITSPTPTGSTTPLKPVSVGVNPLTGLALVANQSTNAATVIDLTTNTVAGTVGDSTRPVSTGATPGVAIEPRLNWAIVTPGGAGSISIVDLGRRSVIATLLAGTGVRGISINTETQRALMADPTTSAVLLFSALDQTLSSLLLETGHVATAVNSLTDVGVSVNSTAGAASVLDLRTPVRLGTPLTVGTNPAAVAIDPGSNVAVVANEGSGNVSIISLGTIRSPHLTQIALPVLQQFGPMATLTSSVDLPITVTGFGFVNGAVVRLDETAVATTFVSSRRLTAVVPAAMLAGPRRYAVDVENPGPVRSNVSDLTVMQAVTVGTAPRGVAIDAERNLAVVTNSGSNDISLVDLNAGTAAAPIAVGTNPQGVAVIARLGRAVVANRGSNNVSVVDLAMGSVAATVPVGTEPIGVAIHPDTAQAVVANSVSNNLSVFDAASNLPGMPATVGVDIRPVALAIDPVRGVAAVAHATQNTLALVDLRTSTILGRVPNFQIPTGVAFDPVSDRFVVVSSLSNNLGIVNPATFQVTPVRVGINPTSLAYNFQSSTLVTVNSTSQTVSVMDFIGRRVRAVLGLSSSQQFAVDIHPRMNLAVIADEGNNRVLLVPLPR